MWLSPIDMEHLALRPTVKVAPLRTTVACCELEGTKLPQG